VPRSDDFGNWKYEHFGPQYPDRYADVTPPRKDDGGNVPKPPQPVSGEWKPVRVQVAAPDEKSGHPGTIIEAEYAQVGIEVRVKYERRVYAEAIKPGDDPVMVARRLLRAKWNTHGGDFYAPIRYPTKGYH
jgi:hypothetical protein